MKIKIWTCCPKIRLLFLGEVDKIIQRVFLLRPDLIVVDESIYFNKKSKKKFLKKICRNEDAIRIYISNTRIIPDLNFFDYAFYDGEGLHYSNRVYDISKCDSIIKILCQIFEKHLKVRPDCSFVTNYVEMYYYASLSTIGKYIYLIKRKILNRLNRIFK